MSRRAVQVQVANVSRPRNRGRVARAGLDDRQAQRRLRDRGRAREIIEQLLGFVERTTGRRLRFRAISAAIAAGGGRAPKDRLADWILCHVIQETREADRREVCSYCRDGSRVCSDREHAWFAHHHWRGLNGHEYRAECPADAIPRANGARR